MAGENYVLLGKHSFNGITWAVLGDADYGNDFLNFDHEHPSKAVIRLYCKDEDKLSAAVSNLGNTICFDLDEKDFYDCIFHNILWYNTSLLGTIYEEFESNVLGTGSQGLEGPWFPSFFGLIADDTVYGSEDEEIYEDYKYFKVVEFTKSRVNGFDVIVDYTLALSETGDGNPQKMVHFHGEFILTDLTKCEYRKSIHYYDVGGSSGEETIDHKYAVEWSTAEVGDLVTPYDSTKYELNALCEVDEIGVDPEDSDLHYISYKGKEGTSATNIAHVNAIVAGTEDATDSNKKVLNATNGNVSDGQTFINSWSQFGDNENVYTATGSTNGSTFNYLMIYNPKYDIYQVWGANASYNSDCKGDFTSYPSKMSGGGATIVDTSDPNCDVFTCTYGGKMYVGIVPKSSLVGALQDAGKGVDFYTFKAEGCYNMVKDPAKHRDIAAMISPITNEPPIPAGMYCYSIIDDYNAYLSDYEHVDIEELIPTMEYEYCEYYEGITTSSTSLKIYDGTTELDDATALTGTVTSVSTVEGTSMTKIEFTDSSDQSYKIYFVKCGTNKDGYIKKSLVVAVLPAMANGLHETDFRGIAFNNMYLSRPLMTIQNFNTVNPTDSTKRLAYIYAKPILNTAAFNSSWTPAELGDILYPLTNLDPDMPPDLYFKRNFSGETFALSDWYSKADGTKTYRTLVYFDQATGLVIGLSYQPNEKNQASGTFKNFIGSYKYDKRTLASYSVYAQIDDVEVAKTAAAQASFKANSIISNPPTSATQVGLRFECVECAVGRGNMFNIWKVTGLVYEGVTPGWGSDDSFYCVELCPVYTDMPPQPVDNGNKRSTDDYLSWSTLFRKGTSPATVAAATIANNTSFIDVATGFGTNSVFNNSGSIRKVHTLDEAEAIVNMPYYHAT